MDENKERSIIKAWSYEDVMAKARESVEKETITKEEEKLIMCAAIIQLQREADKSRKRGALLTIAVGVISVMAAHAFVNTIL